jgi:hypothetical protein
MTVNSTQRFNRLLLDEILKKDQAVLISEHKTYNRETKPVFRCICGKEENNRTFRDMSKKEPYWSLIGHKEYFSMKFELPRHHHFVI